MTAGFTTASRLRETWGYLRWFYWPFGSMSARDIYELVSTNAFSNQGLYLNLGYWKDAATIDEACEAMARLLAETARFTPADTVLDVGFGFGDQDILWAERYGVRRIVGLNITPSQVALARDRVRERGLDDRIELLEASATDMPLQPASVDAVVGLECAFHFDTRERFLHEAFRVLRPGGRLALADVVPNAPVPGRLARRIQRMNWNTFSKKYSVPEANADSHDAYRAKLEGAEIRDVIESIRHHVYPGLHAYMKRDPRMLARFHPLARLPYKLTLFFDPEKVYSAYDYILVSAEKPA